MNIGAIGSAIKNISQTAKNTVDTVGDSSIKYAKNAGRFVSGKMPSSIKKIKLPESVDTFVKTAKDKAKKSDLVEASAKFVKNNAKTIVGVAVLAAAISSAAAIIKTVVDKVKEAKSETKIATHQG